MKIQHWSIDGLRLVEKEFNPAAIIEIKMPNEKRQDLREAALLRRIKETQQPTRKPREDYKQSAANSYGFAGELTFEEMKELYAGRSYASKKKSPSSETLGAAKSVPTFSPTSFGGGG